MTREAPSALAKFGKIDAPDKSDLTRETPSALAKISIANLIDIAQPLHPEIFSRDVADALNVTYRGKEINARFAIGDFHGALESGSSGNKQIVRFSVAIPKGVKPSSNGRYNAGADNAGSVTDGHESRELTPKSAAPIRRFAQSISKSGAKGPRDFERLAMIPLILMR